MADKSGDSHLSQKGSGQVDENSAVPQRHRNRLGESVNGTSDPNGGMPSTDRTIKNQPKNY